MTTPLKYDVAKHSSPRVPVTYYVTERQDNGAVWNIADCAYEKWAWLIADALNESH